MRDLTRRVYVGSVPVGGGAEVSVQSMTKTDTRDSEATLEQIRALARAGCEIVRVAVPDEEAASVLPRICAGSSIPVVADIHFNYKLALLAIEAGVAKLRINPGNIGGPAHVREVAACAEAHGVPIRIGVNAGSLERDLLEKHGRGPEAMVESAMRHVAMLERVGFQSIVISLKASDVRRTVEAYRLIASRAPYPLHVGVTEAGPPPGGLVKSATGIGIILAAGIGDTIRVSLTGDPLAEVTAGKQILESLELRSYGPIIVSCPTCGRCRSDVIGIAREIAEAVSDIKWPLTIAVMGCEVNGPGEASDADLGVACGNGVGLLFAGGRPVRKVPESQIIAAITEAAREAARGAARERAQE
ncbi:MAG: flavodoxin-dependent (E)-4-hydroxy-3-methylbut-2-enyl-diphosphate synthase [Clostridia bacterium]|nr:flavodoxin-dependent (E)-4-hydroxy-3-methylbut-2-enyl-diphosphate synthase [Clostridia bacterium]